MPHLFGGHPAVDVLMHDGVTLWSALDLGERKQGRHGRLAKIMYLYVPWTGWVREERLQ